MEPRCKNCIYPEYRPGGVELPVSGFIRDEAYSVDPDDERSVLTPVCEFHRGKCHETFVPLDAGLGEWAAGMVLDE